jgi:hypothetical protein
LFLLLSQNFFIQNIIAATGKENERIHGSIVPAFKNPEPETYH